MKQGFTQIPNRIIQSGKKLTDEEFRLYCTLVSYDFQRGFVFPGRKRMADEMGASLAKIDRVKKNLEEKGAFKKKRRGQGETNLYYINKDFLIETDNSPVSGLGDSSTSGKEEEDNKTIYNYLKTSFSFKETSFNKPQPYSKTEPKGKTPTDVIFLSQLKKLQINFDSQLNGLTDTQLNKDYGLSRDTETCIQGILYYIRKYKAVLGVDHTLYKIPQLRDCMTGFLNGIWDIEQKNLPVEETVIRAIERWYATTERKVNNLRLSHFVGQTSDIFLNCIEAVMNDVGIYEGGQDVNS